MLKIAAVAPIPSATVSAATAVQPGVFANNRSARRMSCRSASSHNQRADSYDLSSTLVTFPKTRRAAASASSSLSPAAR